MAAHRDRSRKDGIHAVSDPESERQYVPISEFARGRRYVQLITDLAMGEWSLETLSQTTGVSLKDLRAFEEEHANDISEVAQALSGQMQREAAGLWITKKQFRIAELQQMYEMNQDALEDIEAMDAKRAAIGWSRARKDLFKTQMDLLRQVADELGAFPQRQAQVARTGTTVHYVIETDSEDVEAMR